MEGENREFEEVEVLREVISQGKWSMVGQPQGT